MISIEPISSEILEILSQDFANPFHDNFDLKKIKSCTKDHSKSFRDLIHFLEYTNKTHRKLDRTIDKNLENLNLTNSELLPFFYKYINAFTLDIHKKMYQQFAENVGHSFHVDGSDRPNFVLDDGKEIPINQMAEMGGDILALMIRYSQNWTINKNQIYPQVINVDSQIKIFFEIWSCFNYHLNLESCYATLIYENGQVVYNEAEKSFNFYSGLRWIFMLSKASEYRNNSNIHEYDFHLQEIARLTGKTELGIKSYKSDEGLISFELGDIPISKNLTRAQVIFDLRFSFLASLKLKKFNELELIDLIPIICKIADIGEHLSQSFFTTNKKVALKNTALYIKREWLITYLIRCTDHTSELVEKVILSMTSSKLTPYLWRRPLIASDNRIYININSLSAPNFLIIIEEILKDAEISLDQQQKLLKKEIEKEIKSFSTDYTFDILDSENEPEGFENNILCELEHYVIVFQVVCFHYPIESSEFSKTLEKLSTEAENLKEKKKKIQSTYEKPLVPVLISNYNKFSNLNILEVPFIDLHLLKNYVSTGSFRKVQMIFDSSQPKIKETANLSYYNNERGFNDNFLNFLLFAPPIQSILERLKFKRINVSPEQQEINLITDKIETIEEEENLGFTISKLENSLIQIHFYNFADFQKQSFYEKINFDLNLILQTIAFGNYDLSSKRLELLEVIKKAKVNGLMNMFIAIENAISKISYKNVKKDKTFNHVDFTEADINTGLSIIFKNLNGREIRLFGFKIENGVLEKRLEKKIISACLSYLRNLSTQPYSDEELENFFQNILILNGFRHKYSLDHEFFAICSNYTDSLNHNHKYQRARNFCEEILLISIEEKKPHFGWLQLFNCLTFQQNPFEAAVNGALFYTSIIPILKPNYSLLVNVISTGLKFFRNFSFNPGVEKLYELSKNIHLDDYDDQKIRLTYYLNLINHKPEDIEEKWVEIHDYIIAQKDLINSFGSHGIIPWLNLLYNLERLEKAGILKSQIDISRLMSEFEDLLSEKEVEGLQQMHFNNGDKQEHFLNALFGVLETNNIEDFTFETKNLELQAKLLLAEGLADKDIDKILLTSFILNDHQLTFDNKNTYFKQIVRSLLSIEEDLKEKLRNYRTFLETNLSIRDNEILIWLFVHDGNVFQLSYESRTEFQFKQLNNWSLDKMKLWLSKKPNFYFEETDFFDFQEQEESYKETYNELKHVRLEIENKDLAEVFISSSIDLAEFPVNMIATKNDFLGSAFPVTNILSFEWFIKYGKQKTYPKNFTSTAWIPIHDEDVSINLSYKHIKPILEANKCQVLNYTYFDETIETDINIFLAHGELGFESFRGIYTNEEKAVENPERLFGTGKIAILFICNSGYANGDILSNSISSLCYDILKKGYEAVIAPFWRLNILIPSYWLDTFFKSLKEQYRLSEAVFLANNELNSYKSEISTGFLVPEGKLAMHLYGNPNIIFK